MWPKMYTVLRLRNPGLELNPRVEKQDWRQEIR